MKQNNPTHIARQIVLQIALALAVGILIIFSISGFFLSSISRFILYLVPLTSLIWVVLFLSYYRKNQIELNFPLSLSILNGLSTLVITFHLVPQQLSLFKYSIVIFLVAGSVFTLFQILIISGSAAQNQSQERIFIPIALLLLISNLTIIFYNARFVRIYGDDFSYVIKLERLGVWGSSLLFYQTWSGRFFSNFLVMGFSNKPWAPLLFLVCIQISFLMTMRIFWSSGSILKKIAASILIPLTIYTITPDLYKSLYWNGAAMYLLPILLMIPIYLILAFNIANNKPHKHIFMIILGGILSFAITTCNESAAIGWMGMHLAGILWLWLARVNHKNLRNFFLMGLFTSILGLSIMVASPGASARYVNQEYSAAASISTLLMGSTSYFLGFLRDISNPIYVHHGFIRPGWLFLLGLFGFGWLIHSPLRRGHLSAFLIFAASLAMVFGAFIPGALILGETIPYRTQFIPSMFLAFGTFFFGLLLPQSYNQLHRPKLASLFLLILVVGSTINLIQLSKTIGPMRQYARDWDARDELIRATNALPRRLNVPWDEYEQNLGDFRNYYRTRK